MSRIVSFTCPGCGKEALKPASAVNRAAREGRPIYCGRACFASFKTFLTPELKLQKAREYRVRNADRRRARDAARRRGPEREATLAAQRAYYHRNRDVCNERNRAWNEANKGRRSEAYKRWCADHPEKVDLNNARAVLAESMKIARSEVPADLAEAKAMLWQIQREIAGARLTPPSEDIPK